MAYISRPYIGLIPIAILIALMVAFGIFAEQAARTAQFWVNHTSRVIELLQQEMVDVLDAETGARGYLLNQDEAYLAPYNASRQTIAATTEQLRQAVSDNPEQAARFKALTGVIDAKLELLTRAVTLAKAGHRNEILTAPNSHAGLNYMADIQQRIDEMIASEQSLMTLRQGHADDTLRRAKWATLLGAVAAALSAACCFEA